MIPIVCVLFIIIGGLIILRSTRQHDRELEINDNTYAPSDSQTETKG